MERKDLSIEEYDKTDIKKRYEHYTHVVKQLEEAELDFVNIKTSVKFKLEKTKKLRKLENDNKNTL